MRYAMVFRKPSFPGRGSAFCGAPFFQTTGCSVRSIILFATHGISMRRPPSCTRCGSINSQAAANVRSAQNSKIREYENLQNLILASCILTQEKLRCNRFQQEKSVLKIGAKIKIFDRNARKSCGKQIKKDGLQCVLAISAF